MAEPEYKTLHRAGLASDGWERFKAVLDEYLLGALGAPVVAPTSPPTPGQSLTINQNGEAQWTFPGNMVDQLNVPPASPSAFDDEFDDGDPDPANRDWTVISASGVPGTPYTYLGPVDYTINPGTDMSNYQYRSSLVNGKLRMQFGGSINNLLLKTPISGAATYVARLQNSSSGPGAAAGIYLVNDPLLSVFNAGNAAIINEVSESISRVITYQASVTTTQITLTDQGQARAGSIFWCDWKNSGTLATMLQINDSGALRISLFNQSLAAGPFAPTAVGIWIRNAISSPTTGPQYTEIDYFRVYPSGFFVG